MLAARAALAKIYVDAVCDRRWAAVFWLALGGGVMLKGLVILLVALGAILLLTITEGRIAWLRRLRPGWVCR